MSKINTIKKQIRLFFFVLIWTLCTAQQCSDTVTDACGTYTTQPGIAKITLAINTSNIPSYIPTPVTQNLSYIDNAVNIQGSIYSPNPKTTMFGLKTETYALCNSTPRFSTSCCVTNKSNSCYFSGDENIYQLSAIYQGAFKNKVIIRAIVDNHESNNFQAGSFLYEGTIDLDATTGNIPIDNICILNFIKNLSQSPSPNPIEFCKFNK